MPESTFVIEIVKNAGMPALIFGIWFIYHQSQVRIWTANQELQTKVFDRISTEQSKREDQNYELLKEMLEIARYQAAILARMDNKIDTNQFCPLVKKSSTT